MSTCARTTLFIVGRPLPTPGTAPVVGRHYIAPDYFRTLGIPLLRGRSFAPDDRADRPRVAIINQTAARRFWPDADPIGKRVWFGSGTGFDDPSHAAEIVGIVGDVKYWPLEEPVGPDFYTPYLQFTYPSTMVILKTAGDPLTLVPTVRAALRSVDKDLPISDVRTIEERAGEALSAQRFSMTLLGIFAVASLALASIGMYGVTAYSVAQRTQEIAIRRALGAEANQVVWLFLRRGLGIAIIGIAIGILGAAGTGGVLRSMVYGVSTADPLTFACVSVLFLVFAFLANFIPSRRAIKVPPVVALRSN